MFFLIEVNDKVRYIIPLYAIRYYRLVSVSQSHDKRAKHTMQGGAEPPTPGHELFYYFSA